MSSDTPVGAPEESGDGAPSALELRMDKLENRIEQVATPRATQRAVFVCHYCGTSEERDVPNHPTSWVEVLQGVREEVRMCALMDAPRVHGQPPPHDMQVERELCAAAVLGLRPPHFALVRREHFISAFFGWIWQIANETQHGRPNLEAMAYQFEARGIGRADIVLPELQRLGGPWIAARCDRLSVERLLALAWQRDMLYEAEALAGWLRQDVGVDVVDTVARLKVLRDKLKQGPLG